MIAACNQIETTAPTLDEDDFAISEVKSINEDDLIELSVFLGEVFKDVEARRELFDFAEIEGNDEDIEYSLKTLFQNQTNPVKRTRSAIVNAFHKTAENLRMEGQVELSVDKLIQFINDNDIGILAPYLYDNFNPSDITELTVSWYLEEEEIRMLEQDPDWEGETKGLKLRMDENGTFIQLSRSLKMSDDLMSQLVIVNDDYAKKNPTIVIGSFEDEVSNTSNQYKKSNENASIQSFGSLPHTIGVNCTNVLPTDIVRWTMPEFNLTGNARGWPHPNRVTIWVNSSSNLSSAPFIDEKKISRGNVNKWLSDFIPNNGTIATSWEQSNFNQHVVIAVKRPSNKVDETVIVSSVNSKGEITNNASVKLKKGLHYRATNQSWLRCGELNGNYRVDNGNNFRGTGQNRLAIWAYGINRKEYEVQFTLAPRIIR